MAPQTITLSYRKIIDQSSLKPWDKLVFDDSFMEFRMQAQTIAGGGEVTSYGALLQRFPAAQNLAARVTPAIAGYVQQLNSVIPDLLNNIGKRFLKFESYAFEIINSDVNDITRHQIVINFYSEPLLWHNTIGNYMLLSSAKTGDVDSAVLTNLFQLQPYVNIHSLQI